MLIEERAIKKYGTTTIPEFAGYMLTDGSMLNFSYEGHQRDIDHREINEFFRGSYGSEVITRMMQRGNIRCSCSGGVYGFELIKVPTREQWRTLNRINKEAKVMGYSFFVEKPMPNRRIRTMWYEDLVDWLYEEANYSLC